MAAQGARYTVAVEAVETDGQYIRFEAERWSKSSTSKSVGRGVADPFRDAFNAAAKTGAKLPTAAATTAVELDTEAQTVSINGQTVGEYYADGARNRFIVPPAEGREMERVTDARFYLNLTPDETGRLILGGTAFSG